MQHQNRPSKSNRMYLYSWVMKAIILFYVLGTFYWINWTIALNLRKFTKMMFVIGSKSGGNNENMPIHPTQLNLLPYRCMLRGRCYHKDWIDPSLPKMESKLSVWRALLPFCTLYHTIWKTIKSYNKSSLSLFYLILSYTYL